MDRYNVPVRTEGEQIERCYVTFCTAGEQV
jgi:hypothetical protein